MMGMEILSTGDKILHTMKEMEMSIPGLAALSGVHENTLLDIMAGIREPDMATLCKIADALDVCVRDLCPDKEHYAVPVEKDTLAKLIVVSEINGVELDALIASILEKGIEENGFYD
jgi:transcriptional regulator with XRE-family HTH domain